MPVARARASRTGNKSDFTTLTYRNFGAVQSALGVGGCGNIRFGHELIAVRQGQRRDAFATGEQQLSRFAARKSKYTLLYLYSGKLVLAATYLRRVFVDGRHVAAGAQALTHVCTVGACGLKPRRRPPAAMPGEGVWRRAWGGGAHCPSAAHEAMVRIAPRFLVPQPNGKQKLIFGHQLRVDSLGVDSRF
jgi:hypothetical protein